LVGYLTIGLVAALVTAAMLPLVIRFGYHFGVLAQPDGERRLHAKAVPQVGGIAMLFGVLAGLFVAWRMQQFRDVFVSTSEPIGIVVGALIITGIGLIDDRLELSPPAKMAGIVLAGSSLYFLGVTLDQVQVPFFGAIQISPDFTALVTVLWLVGMCNAINLIDGLDGLAAGIVAIASVAFFLYSTRLFDSGVIDGSNLGPLVAVVCGGVCLGFLPFNFNPARVFMGDSGALLLGLLLAVSTSVVGGRSVPGVRIPNQTYFFLAPLFIPLLILVVPIADTARLLVQRTVRRSGFSTADREHIHYRLVELGHGPRRTVLILWSLTTIASAFVLAPMFFSGQWPIIPLVILLVITVAFALLHPDLWKRRAARREVITESEGVPR
jgi:UDP-GlcNAc:undecaprenyl-phosphate/decaprenyl-phosphate GlcNAc-1-phosphate transferase